MSYDPTTPPTTLPEAILYAERHFEVAEACGFVHGWAIRDGDANRTVLDLDFFGMVGWAREQLAATDRTPPLHIAADALNPRRDYAGIPFLRLNTQLDPDTWVSQKYDATIDGEKTLLRAAARAIADGRDAYADLAPGLVGKLTAEALACDCGKGIWCPLVEQQPGPTLI